MSENDNNYPSDLNDFNDWISETVRFRDSENIKICRSTDEIGRVLEDICAFANTGRGIVYFGVDDSGIVIGGDYDGDKINKVITEIFLRISPSLFPRIFIKKYDGKPVLGLDIMNAPDKPYFFDGKYFKRMGASNMSLFPHEIKIFMDQKKSPHYFDMEISPGYHGGMNQERFDWYLSQAEIYDKVSSMNKPDDREIMKRLGLLTENKMNSAAVLCFGIELKEVFSNAKIICQVIDGLDEDGEVRYEETIEGDLFAQLEAAEQFIENRLPEMIQSQEGDRDWAEYLSLLVNEAVATAIIHRDYRIKDPIGLLIFTDHVEIYIPGNLRKWLTGETVRSDQVVIPPNPILAKLFFLAGLTEYWLPSMDKFDKIMSELNLPIPEYLNDDKFIGLILRWKKAPPLASWKKKKRQAEVYVHQASHQTKAPADMNHIVHDYSHMIASTESYTSRILVFCMTPRSRVEIQDLLQLKDRKHFREAILNPLISASLLKMTIPRKPNSPKQKYVITAKGARWLDNRNISV